MSALAQPLTRTHNTASLMPVRGSLLQRKCSCGSSAGLTGKCDDCEKKKLAGALQKKLTVNEPGDAYEQEADRVAEQVMRMPAPVSAVSQNTAPVISRAATGGGGGTEAPAIVHDVLHSSGQPLDASTRAFMEPRFGHDFSGVRVHTDARAAESARAVNALAYTVGNNVVFGDGQYAPGSGSGQRLLAHELTHVVQQGKGLRKVGIKSPADSILRGVVSAAKTIFGNVMASLEWVRDSVVSGFAWVWDFVTWLPLRVWSLVRHVATGVADIGLWLWDVVQIIKGNLDLLQWFGKAVVGGAAWVGRLFAKILDLFGVGELWTFVMSIVKVNTRTLTNVEKVEAQKVFADSISYWQVRIDEMSLIAAIGSYLQKGGGMGVTTAHTINFNEKLSSAPGNDDMAWLVHELVHVAQYTHVGLQYIGEALHAQSAAGYHYGGGVALIGKDLKDFNREQQGDILRDYYVRVLYGAYFYAPEYERMRNQAVRGQF